VARHLFRSMRLDHRIRSWHKKESTKHAVNWTLKCTYVVVHHYSLREGACHGTNCSLLFAGKMGSMYKVPGQQGLTLCTRRQHHTAIFLLFIAAHVELTLQSGRYTSTPILSATCDTNRHPGISKRKNPKMMLIQNSCRGTQGQFICNEIVPES
jgi:hypothetical protein